MNLSGAPTWAVPGLLMFANLNMIKEFFPHCPNFFETNFQFFKRSPFGSPHLTSEKMFFGFMLAIWQLFSGISIKNEFFDVSKEKRFFEATAALRIFRISKISEIFLKNHSEHINETVDFLGLQRRSIHFTINYFLDGTFGSSR